MNSLSIEDAVFSVKEMIEKAIRDRGLAGKNSLIRSQQPIRMLHDAVKSEFADYGVSPSKIRPPFGMSQNDELRLAGLFKFKSQDVCILPNHMRRKKEILRCDGVLNHMQDNFGAEFTEHILSVNVRSQLSSIAKNFDTLYERTFAEALNLHLRCPRMVLGDLYMIPVYEYDDASATRKKVGFKRNKDIQKHIEKYLLSFSALNNRRFTSNEEYKYERICLLIVDFSKRVPVIYSTDDELMADGLLRPLSNASIDDMNFNSFCPTLLSVYERRFGSGMFI